MSTAAAAGPSSQEILVYGGEIFGDRLTERTISGSTPRLNDSATFGGRYTFNYTDSFGVQLSAGYSPGRAGHVRSGDSSLGITTVDLDGVWNFTPGYKIVGYAVAGVGYEWADLDRAIQGSVGGLPMTITDSNGYTENAGPGAKYHLTDNLFVDLVCEQPTPTPRNINDRRYNSGYEYQACPDNSYGLWASASTEARSRTGKIKSTSSPPAAALTGNIRAPIIPLIYSGAAIAGISIGPRRAQEDMIRAIDHCGIKPVIAGVYDFADVPDAFRHFDSRIRRHLPR